MKKFIKKSYSYIIVIAVVICVFIPYAMLGLSFTAYAIRGCPTGLYLAMEGFYDILTSFAIAFLHIAMLMLCYALVANEWRKIKESNKK